MEMSPDKSRRSTKKSTIGGLASPNRVSTGSHMMTGSRMSSSPSKGGQFLDMHKKTCVDLKESPSKSARIMMKYINSYPDVGPQVAQP